MHHVFCEIFVYELILLFLCKLISLDILLQMLWNFYAMLWIVLGGSDNYVMIFGVLYLCYVIYVNTMA